MTPKERIGAALRGDEVDHLPCSIYFNANLVVTGARPLLGDIADAGFDCVEGFEPVLSRCANADVHAAFAGRSCIWTGVSSPGHLGASDDAPARRAVRQAVEVFGRRGFILGVTNSIRGHWRWENTLAMIDEWRKLR